MTAAADVTPGSDYGLMELDRDQCLTLLASAPVGRLVHTMRAMPAIVPVNFVLLRGRIYIRTSEAAGEKLVHDGSVVAFEADAFDADHRTGWNVVVLGRASSVTDPVLLAELADLPLLPWASGQREYVVCIPVELVTGRRVGRGPLPLSHTPGRQVTGQVTNRAQDPS